MNVSFICRRCEQGGRAEILPGDGTVICPNCQSGTIVPAAAIQDGRLRRCLLCPSSDLFVRKDFPQRLGVVIVIVGFAASCVTWYYYEPIWTYVILFATALIDAALYFVCGEALQCYRCGAIYRGVPGLAEHSPFSLDVHERHRQQAARETEAAKGSGFRVQGSDAHSLNPEP